MSQPQSEPWLDCTCGKPHTQGCHAHSKRHGGPCNAHAMRNQTVCKAHGGKAPQNLAAAQRKADEAAALAIVTADAGAILAHTATIGITNPMDQLARLALEASAFKDALAKRINALTQIRYEDGKGEQLRSEVALYERALDRTHKFLEALTKLGYDERRVQLEERHGELIAAAIAAVIADHDLGLTPEQKKRARGLAATHLRAVPD